MGRPFWPYAVEVAIALSLFGCHATRAVGLPNIRSAIFGLRALVSFGSGARLGSERTSKNLHATMGIRQLPIGPSANGNRRRPCGPTETGLLSAKWFRLEMRTEGITFCEGIPNARPIRIGHPACIEDGNRSDPELSRSLRQAREQRQVDPSGDVLSLQPHRALFGGRPFFD